MWISTIRSRNFRVSIGLMIAVVALILLSQLPEKVVAQDGQRLEWGESTLGAVTGPEGAVYNFTGSGAEAVEIDVLGIGDFKPTIMVYDANRTLLTQDNNSAGVNQLLLSYRLPGSGVYLLQIGGLNGSLGQFTVTINRELPPGIPLIEDVPTPGIVTDSFGTVFFEFDTRPDTNAKLEVRSLTAGYSPFAQVYDSAGQTVVKVDGQSRLVAAVLEFGPGNETLTLAVDQGGFQGQADFQVLLTYGGTSPADTDPVGTPEVRDGTCFVAAEDGRDVNIRSGGSTNHPIIGVLRGNETLPATGFNNANGGWYSLALPDGRTGWIASFVVTTTGDCGALPAATYGPVPASTQEVGGGGGDSPPPQATPPVGDDDDDDDDDDSSGPGPGGTQAVDDLG